MNYGDSFAKTKNSDQYSTAYEETTSSLGYKQGDATFETRGWHDDYQSFINSEKPFFIRGGNYTYGTFENSGVFAYCGYEGFSNTSFRMCIILK